MKIYFAGSINGGREKESDYLNLISFLENYGEVITKDIWHEEPLNKDYIYNRHKKWLDESDLIIAEVSVPSLGVGYELGYAGENNKKIICLYDDASIKNLSSMISGNPKNIIIRYKTLEEAKSALENAIIDK
ncbi:MAG: nucleoside 2-deoxyribosyltransferase [Bacilli bacterium]|nr:nucleoside 2-deoxyribosyltransferase [Bacilli bacterium]MDD4796072.1 nucleoside 2-deoxyribosyltransferase [Bacilli bacterium]